MFSVHSNHLPSTQSSYATLNKLKGIWFNRKPLKQLEMWEMEIKRMEMVCVPIPKHTKNTLATTAIEYTRVKKEAVADHSVELSLNIVYSRLTLERAEEKTRHIQWLNRCEEWAVDLLCLEQWNLAYKCCIRVKEREKVSIAMNAHFTIQGSGKINVIANRTTFHQSL